MIIDCHGHYTTAPKSLWDYRDKQVSVFDDPKALAALAEPHSWRRRERRGCLRSDLFLPDGSVLYLCNVHLGTSFIERRHQAR